MKDSTLGLLNFKDQSQNKNKFDNEELEVIKDEINTFFSDIVIPAFEELSGKLKNLQREVELAISSSDNTASLIVNYKDQIEYEYTIKIRINQGKAFPYPEIQYRESADGVLFGAESTLREGDQDYNICHIKREEIVQHFLSDYVKQYHFV